MVSDISFRIPLMVEASRSAAFVSRAACRRDCAMAAAPVATPTAIPTETGSGMLAEVAESTKAAKYGLRGVRICRKRLQPSTDVYTGAIARRDANLLP